MNMWWIAGIGAVFVLTLVIVAACGPRASTPMENAAAQPRDNGERPGGSDSRGGQPPTLSFEDFLAPVPASSLAGMLEQWQWLPIRELRPTAMTLMGDVFLIDRDNRIYFLDTSFGVLERVADSNEHFSRRLNDEVGFAPALLRSDLLIEIQSTGVITGLSHAGVERGPANPAPGQVCVFGVPLIAGGRPEASNVVLTDAGVYMDMQGQLTAGASRLEPGTEFATRFENWPEVSPPPGAQRRRLVRAARDRRSFALPD
ncbi:MAG: hypothetical protein ACK6CU_02880 [Deltaproteobacteria bacterium]|jgi:hypothetical protein